MCYYNVINNIFFCSDYDNNYDNNNYDDNNNYVIIISWCIGWWLEIGVFL